MPELPELEVVRDILTRRILGQSIVSAEVILPGGRIVVRDLTGEGYANLHTNADADEILWWARLDPYCKRTSLTAAEIDRLYDGRRACLLEVIAIK